MLSSPPLQYFTTSLVSVSTRNQHHYSKISPPHRLTIPILQHYHHKHLTCSPPIHHHRCPPPYHLSQDTSNTWLIWWAPPLRCWNCWWGKVGTMSICLWSEGAGKHTGCDNCIVIDLQQRLDQVSHAGVSNTLPEGRGKRWVMVRWVMIEGDDRC